MAIYKSDIVDIDLETGSIHRSFIMRSIGEGDKNANRFGVRVKRNGSNVNLSEATCSGYFIRSNGDTVVIAGETSGNEAYVVLPQACYTYEGQFSLAIKLTGGGLTGTMRIVDGVVSNTTTDTLIDPGTIIPSIDTLIAAIEAAVASIPPEYAFMQNEIDEITEKTNNLFDIQKIVIGINASGTSGFPKRALSGPMYVGSNRAMIKAINLPSNLKYDVEWYTSASASSVVNSSAWITDDTTYDYTGEYPYIRILFGSVDDNELTVEDFQGLIMQVNAGTTLQDYDPHLIAKDTTARKMVQIPEGLFPMTGWEQGSLLNGAETNSEYRIRSGYVDFEQGAGLIITDHNPESGYDISFTLYDKNKTFLSDGSYPTTNPQSYRTHKDAKYIRFVIRKDAGNSMIFPYEAYNTRLEIKYCGENTRPFNLKVMTYNLGRYSYGSEPWGLNDNNYDEKLTNYRRFFGKEKCDIVCLQEWDRVIKYGSPDIESDTVLFSHWYDYNQNSGNWTAIKSKYWMQNDNLKQLTDGRYYSEGNITVGDKCIYVLDVHLSPGFDETGVNTRYAEVTEVLGLVEDKERFIICGDFNPNPDEYHSMYQRFIDAGYNVANGGFFGDFWTWTTNRADFDSDTPTGTLYYVDNIITSANIDIISAERVNVYDQLSSDHIPIIAELSVKA